MQVTIARQLGLEPTTVGNFFMNARRRSMDKWKEDQTDSPSKSSSSASSSANTTPTSHTSTTTTSGQHIHVAQVVTVHHTAALDEADAL